MLGPMSPGEAPAREPDLLRELDAIERQHTSMRLTPALVDELRRRFAGAFQDAYDRGEWPDGYWCWELHHDGQGWVSIQMWRRDRE
jgi:hypothetical protein